MLSSDKNFFSNLKVCQLELCDKFVTAILQGGGTGRPKRGNRVNSAMPTSEKGKERLVAAYGAMQSQERAGPLEVVIHLDPEFFVIRMEISWREAIADFAGDTSLRKPFAHFINEPPMR